MGRGGDEFAILLAETNDLDGIETRVRHRLAEVTQRLPYALSVSIGVVRCGTDGEYDLDGLLEQADRAMYAEKARKRRVDCC